MEGEGQAINRPTMFNDKKYDLRKFKTVVCLEFINIDLHSIEIEN